MAEGRWRLIAVIGGGDCTAQETAWAEAVGRRLAERGYAVVGGGRGGVMEAACRGARLAGGHCVGILPGVSPDEANPFVEVVIATGIGEARNSLVVSAAEAVIAIGGEAGTLSEIGLALKAGKRVVGLNSWRLTRPDGGAPGIAIASSPEEAVAMAAPLHPRDAPC